MIGRPHRSASRRVAGFVAVVLVVGLAPMLAPAPAGAVTIGAPSNATARAGDEDESAVAVNPNNTQQIAVMTNGIAGDAGLPLSFSSDGGQTWTRTVFATGTGAGGDGRPVACCDPTLSWDDHGNLFVGYLQRNPRTIELYVTSDLGANFTNLGPVDTGAAGTLDQPTVVAAENSVWVTWRDDSNGIAARGRSVTGALTFGTWGAEQDVSTVGNFGDIAIGPAGEVMVVYQTPTGNEGPSNILVHTDADGLGAGGFGAGVTVGATNVGGFDFVPAQPQRSVDAETGLAWDRTGGVNDDRVYLVYTDETPAESNDFDIFVRTSDDDGANWSAPVQVNDDAGTNTQMLPRIALDQTNGDVAVTFYDARGDTGGGPSATDIDGVANNDVTLFATWSLDGGANWAANVAVADAPTDGYDTNGGQELGDYTGSAFHGGVLYPSWADSSNSTGDNPDGTQATLDVYVAAVRPRNEAPVVAVSPASGAEGAPINVSGTASDANNDALTFGWTATPAVSNDAGSGCNISNGTTLTPIFTCSDDGQYTITLTATGDPAGPVSASNTLTVMNVAPLVTKHTGLTTTIAEGGSFAMGATFVDPGWNDTYSGTIDFGTGAGAAGATVTVTTSGPPRDEGTIAGSFQYGDDGSFTVTAAVTDDDGATGSDAATVTVTNVDPTATIDESGATTVNGTPTIIAQAGDTVAFSGRSTDPGSDDLTLSWDFDDGLPAPDIATSYLVNPPGSDPFPSPSVQPRDVVDAQSHVFGDACTYQVGFASADDDGGTATDVVSVLILGNANKARPSGYWSHQYRREGSTDFDDATLTCYLEIVDFVSDVFHEVRDASTFAAARSLLFTQGNSVTKRDQLDRDLLTTWLNFANGAVGWNEMVDTNSNGVPDTVFHVALETAETVRLNPASTPAQFDAQRAILQSINDSV